MGKCLLFSDQAHVRSAMKSYTFPCQDSPIPVVNHARDLGAHVTYTSRLVTGTLGARAGKVGHVCHRLTGIVGPVIVKQRALRA
eukprot:5963420-Alexandrium_andersonii.AAC.1